MDFGLVSLEALVGPEAGTAGSSKVSEPKTRFKSLGSELVKHEKSWDAEYDWKSSKMAKNDNLSVHKTMPLHQGTPLRRSNALFSGEGRQQEHMLSFSSVKSEVPILRKDGSIVDKGTYTGFPYYQRPPSAYIRNAVGWSSLHLRFSSNNDPEPGRCRRTDGKKWRCSRDAVADQKYCERHINRGRHRSRKPVEGQTGHAASGTANSKVVPMTSSVSALENPSGGASSSLTMAQRQFKNLQPGDAPNPSADALVSRGQVCGRMQDPSSSSSPTQEKLSVSPLRLSREFEPIQMNLGMSADLIEPTQNRTNRTPISWATSMGGPLGEVLTNTANPVTVCKNSSALNLMTEGWDSSPQWGSSPTSVLQKTPFGALSSCSSGTSPGAENKKSRERACQSDDVLGSTLASSSLPSL